MKVVSSLLFLFLFLGGTNAQKKEFTFSFDAGYGYNVSPIYVNKYGVALGTSVTPYEAKQSAFVSLSMMYPLKNGFSVGGGFGFQTFRYLIDWSKMGCGFCPDWVIMKDLTNETVLSGARQSYQFITLQTQISYIKWYNKNGLELEFGPALYHHMGSRFEERNIDGYYNIFPYQGDVESRRRVSLGYHTELYYNRKVGEKRSLGFGPRVDGLVHRVYKDYSRDFIPLRVGLGIELNL